MTLSLYAATVPAFLQILPSIGALCDKGAAWCRDNGKPEADLLEARLADDMWPLARQLRAAWLHSAGAIEGVQKGETAPDFSDPPRDFATLKALIDRGVASLQAATPEAVDSLVGKDTCFRLGERRMDFLVEDYLLTFALPNFFFHATTAYAILRSRGLAIGKRDFLGGLRLKP
ncbi:MAG: DUF1993 domain-containing protein [Novosphingobium sp.]